MQQPKNKISPEIVRHRLKYDAETGNLFWINSSRPSWNGKVAGSKRRDGYIVIVINRELLLAHRLAWVCTYGEWPSTGIDHINGNPSDNRLSNLRLAESCENHWNMKVFANNTSGYRGVTFHRKTGKWVAELWCKRQKYYLGLFDTKEMASDAVESARSRMFGKFNKPEELVNTQ